MAIFLLSYVYSALIENNFVQLVKEVKGLSSRN